MTVQARMQIGPRGEIHVDLLLDAEGAQYVADIMGDEVNRTYNPRTGKRDVGAQEIYDEIYRVLDQIHLREQAIREEGSVDHGGWEDR